MSLWDREWIRQHAETAADESQARLIDHFEAPLHHEGPEDLACALVICKEYLREAVLPVLPQFPSAPTLNIGNSAKAGRIRVHAALHGSKKIALLQLRPKWLRI